MRTERKVRSWGATFVGEASPSELRLFPRLGSFHGRGTRPDELRQVKHLFKRASFLCLGFPPNKKTTRQADFAL
jgi:hypothetical protein